MEPGPTRKLQDRLARHIRRFARDAGVALAPPEPAVLARRLAATLEAVRAAEVELGSTGARPAMTADLERDG